VVGYYRGFLATIQTITKKKLKETDTEIKERNLKRSAEN